MLYVNFSVVIHMSMLLGNQSYTSTSHFLFAAGPRNESLPLPWMLSCSPEYQTYPSFNYSQSIYNYFQSMQYMLPEVLSAQLILSSTRVSQSACPVSWGCIRYWLLLCRGIRPLPTMSVLDMTLNNLMVRFQWCWSFGGCKQPFIAIAPRSTLAQNGSTW